MAFATSSGLPLALQWGFLSQSFQHRRVHVGDHIGEDDAGSDSIDPDAGGPQLLGQSLCQAMMAPLEAE